MGFGGTRVLGVRSFGVYEFRVLEFGDFGHLVVLRWRGSLRAFLGPGGSYKWLGLVDASERLGSGVYRGFRA